MIPLDFRFREMPWGRLVDMVGGYWLGTPYKENARAPGRGVDCVRFTCAILDSLYGDQRSVRLPRRRGEMSLHNRAGMFKAMRLILGLYPNHRRVVNRSLEPGDILVCGPENGGPGHAMVAGGRQGVIWHCSRPGGVERVGYSIPRGHKLFAVFRCTDRDGWTS